MLSDLQARDYVERMTRVRVYSGALGHEDLVMAEGNVMSYIDAPSIELLHDDGKLKNWSTRLRIEEIDSPASSTESDFIAEITRARAQRGWSQERLAAEASKRGCHLTQSAVSRIERGKEILLLTEAIALADLLGVNLRIGGAPS